MKEAVLPSWPRQTLHGHSVQTHTYRIKWKEAVLPPWRYHSFGVSRRSSFNSFWLLHVRNWEGKKNVFSLPVELMHLPRPKCSLVSTPHGRVTAELSHCFQSQCLFSTDGQRTNKKNRLKETWTPLKRGGIREDRTLIWPQQWKRPVVDSGDLHVWNMPQEWIWRVKMISVLLSTLQDWRWPEQTVTDGAGVNDHLRKCCSQRDFCFQLTNPLVIFLKCLHYWEGCVCDGQRTAWPLSSLCPVYTSYKLSSQAWSKLLYF